MNGNFGVILVMIAAIGLFLLAKPTAFIGAGITPATPQPKSWEHVYKPKPKPVSRFKPQTTYRPIRGQQTKQGSKVQEQHKKLVRKYTLSQVLARLTPAKRDAITQTWVVWARKRALAIAQRLSRSGYRPVGYGGFGGSDPGTFGSSIQQALQMSGIGIGRSKAASTTNEYRMATDHLNRFAACDGNKTCGLEEIKKYDRILENTIKSNMTGTMTVGNEAAPRV